MAAAAVSVAVVPRAQCCSSTALDRWFNPPEPEIRHHGFMRPFDTHQASSWVALTLFVVWFYALYLPVHLSPVGTSIACVHFLCLLGTITSGYLSMRTDPSDPGVLLKRKATILGLQAPPPSETATAYCTLCDTYVERRSKHCRRCVCNRPQLGPRAHFSKLLCGREKLLPFHCLYTAANFR
jgi:hypothetical protein